MAIGIPQTVPEHACKLPGFKSHGTGVCSACEKERYRNEPRLKLYRGSVPASEDCSGCFILVLAATERHATDRIWDEVRATFFGVVATEDIHVEEVTGRFTDGRLLCKVVGGASHSVP